MPRIDRLEVGNRLARSVLHSGNVHSRLQLREAVPFGAKMGGEVDKAPLAFGANWDGGYMANPALNPLVDAADDLLTVLIDPLDVAGGPPISPQHIMNRINEVSFGASWVLEMRQIELINKLVRSKQLAGKYHEKRFHLIRDDRFMEAIGALSKMVPARDFLIALRERGRQTAMAWLTEDFHKIGHTSSLNVERELSLRLTGTSDAVRKLARE